MGKVRTFVFHAEYGPMPLFEKARGQLEDLAGLSMENPHAKARFAERGIPVEHLADFRPARWEVITVETAVRTGRITYMSLRRKIKSDAYLWIVLAFEHVITAWITGSPRTRATNPLIVKNGPAWDAAAAGQDPKATGAVAEWDQERTRRARAQQILTALVTLPERPSRDRIAYAARLVLAGDNWSDAAAAAGWENRHTMDNAIRRLLRAAKVPAVADSGGRWSRA